MGYASGRAPRLAGSQKHPNLRFPGSAHQNNCVSALGCMIALLINLKKTWNPGEGSLHPQPKGWGIRDPPHSRCIKELWPNLTAFYFLENAPATNNPVENYYSTSLKTHRKKQLEEPGIEDQMKLSALKRAGIFGRPEKTLLDAFFMFIPFLDVG